MTSATTEVDWPTPCANTAVVTTEAVTEGASPAEPVIPDPIAPIVRTRLSLIELVGLMAGLMSLNALAIDIMLPALPQMGEALAVADPNHRQYVVIVYVLGMGAAQLGFGPISDRFGRRPPLLASLLGYSLFGLLCIFAPSFGVLLVARGLQGVAAAGARVISLSVVRDTPLRPFVLSVNSVAGDMSGLKPPRKRSRHGRHDSDAAVGGGSGAVRPGTSGNGSRASQ